MSSIQPRHKARLWAQTAFPWGVEEIPEPAERARFDAWELDRCAEYEDPDSSGGFYYERVHDDTVPEDARRIVYTIYGHLPKTGVVALTDCTTREDALEILSFLPGDLPVWDYTEGK